MEMKKPRIGATTQGLDAGRARQPHAQKEYSTAGGGGQAHDVLNGLQNALEYIKRGLPVFPCREVTTQGRDKDDKPKTFTAKSPYTAHGCHDATTDAGQVRAWWSRWPKAAIGLRTGIESGLFVIDVDVKNGAPGLGSWEALQKAHGPIPQTRIARTVSGGWHYYFKHPGPGTVIRTDSNVPAPGIDVRGDRNGYVVAPPSIVETGAYVWEHNVPTAEAPDWLLELVIKKPYQPAAPRPIQQPRASTETSAYGCVALEEECALLASTPQGQRHTQLFKSVAALGNLVGGGAILEHDARAGIMSAVTSWGTGAEFEGKTLATIEDALEAGMSEPRQAPEKQQIARGADAVRACIGSAGQVEDKKDEVLGGIISGVDLMKLDIPEITWAVPNLLPMGLAILAGGPKLGKSWLIISICLAIGRGGFVLGQFSTAQAKVLCLCLEDSHRRLQNRIRALLQNEPELEDGLANVDFQTTWPRIDEEGGLERLDEYIKSNLAAGLKLVVIDTLAKIAPKSKSKGLNAYESDSIVMGRVKKLADKHSVCVLLVTHLNKIKPSKDPFDAITGSMGQLGTADTAMLLTRTRGQETAKLLTTGRDIDGETYALRWIKPGWTCTGVDDDILGDMSPERQAVLQAFQNDGSPMSPAMVAEATGKTSKTVSYHIKKLEESGFLFSSGYGLYCLAGSTGSVGSVGSTRSTGSIDMGNFQCTSSGMTGSSNVEPVLLFGENKGTSSTSNTSSEDNKKEFFSEIPTSAEDDDEIIEVEI